MDQVVISFCSGTPNWVEVATLACVVLGGLFAWWQWRRAQNAERIENMRKLLDDFKEESLQKFFYRYFKDVSTNFYEATFRFGDGVEAMLDRLLTLYSTVCYMRERGVIKRSEFSFFAYQIHKSLRHPQTIQYLVDLATYSKTSIRGSYPFLPLVREGARMGIDPVYEKILIMQESKYRTFDAAVGEFPSQLWREFKMWFDSLALFDGWKQ